MDEWRRGPRRVGGIDEPSGEAADMAVQAYGGFGVAREYDVERSFREAGLTRLVPTTQ